MNRSKVFGIGLNKTGTRSLAEAMRMVGYRTLHKGDAATSALVDRASTEGKPLLTYIGTKYDAYFDVDAIVRSYRVLDHQYPGSKFILTTRDFDSWLTSREKHVLANQTRAADGEYDGDWLIVDRPAWEAEWERHHSAVRSYFADRPESLLVIDVAAGEGWPPLCAFLNTTAPRAPFPWENRDGAGTYRSLSPTDRVKRAGRGAMRRARRLADSWR